MADSTPKPPRKPGSHFFQKGQSGNPGGRPKASHDIAALARTYTPEAMAALRDALKDPRQKVAAACAILDRGYGKPTQAVTVDHNFAAAAAGDAALLAIALSGGSAAAVAANGEAGPEDVVH